MSPGVTSRRQLLLAICAACLAASTVRAEFHVEAITLEVVNTSVPEMPIALATFGVPQYGRAVTHLLEYAASADGQLECEYVKENFPTSSQPFILLLDRGSCKFTTKALHAQMSGAAAVLMVDNQVEAQNSLFTMDVGGDADSQLEASKVNVPVALIREDDGATLKALLKKPKGVKVTPKVVVSMNYKKVMKRQTVQVPWNLWVSSDDSCGIKCTSALKFVSDFQETTMMLLAQNRTFFNVHYPVFKCPELATDCLTTRCTNGGRYCANPPANANPYAGKDVVLQNLRSVCVFDQAQFSKSLPMWFTYVSNVAKACSFSKGTFTHDCARQQAIAAGANAALLTACMGQTEVDVIHPRLEEEFIAAVRGNLRGDILESLLPTVSAQGVQYRGKLGILPVLQFICTGFCSASAPAVCPKDLEAKACPATGEAADDYADYAATSDTDSSSTDSESGASSSTGAEDGPAPAPAPGPSSESDDTSDSEDDTPPPLAPLSPPPKKPAPVRPPSPPSPPTSFTVAQLPPPPPSPPLPPVINAKEEPKADGGSPIGGIIAGIVVIGAAGGGGGYWYYKNKILPSKSEDKGGYHSIEMS